MVRSRSTIVLDQAFGTGRINTRGTLKELLYSFHMADCVVSSYGKNTSPEFGRGVRVLQLHLLLGGSGQINYQAFDRARKSARGILKNDLRQVLTYRKKMFRPSPQLFTSLLILHFIVLESEAHRVYYLPDFSFRQWPMMK